MTSPKSAITTNPDEEPAYATASDENIVIAAGCQNSGWEDVIPVLEKAGLNLINDSFTEWYKEQFPSRDLATVSESIQPDDNFFKKAASLISERNDSFNLLADSRNLWLLDFWATLYPGARFLLFYTHSENAVTHALLRKIQDPKNFLASWHTANRELIRFLLSHRDSAILLNVEAAGQQIPSLVKSCMRINLKLETHNFLGTTPTFPITERLVAQSLIKTQPHIQALQLELEARAQPLEDNVSPGNIQADELIQHYLQQKTTEKSLNQQLSQIKKTLETLKKEKTQLQSVIEETLKQTKKAEDRIIYLEKENELLTLQLHNVQEELENYFLKYQELKRQQKESNAPAPAIDIQSVVTTDDKPQNVESQSQLQKIFGLFLNSFKQSNLEILNKKQIKIIGKSEFFDKSWYLSEYPDVAKDGIDPIVHYVLHGADEERNPSAYFNTHNYLQTNPDVAAKKINPLFHYIMYGKKEGRSGINGDDLTAN